MQVLLLALFVIDFRFLSKQFSITYAPVPEMMPMPFTSLDSTLK